MKNLKSAPTSTATTEQKKATPHFKVNYQAGLAIYFNTVQQFKLLYYNYNSSYCIAVEATVKRYGPKNPNSKTLAQAVNVSTAFICKTQISKYFPNEMRSSGG